MPHPAERERIAQLVEIGALLRRLFAGPDVAKRWLYEATPDSLDGAVTPVEALRQGRVDQVLLLLRSLATGV